jgi:alginate O-acetyltransferase complex protein AlgI
VDFSRADYPLFLVAVFFLYGLARAGSWPGAVGRWALMLLLGDLVYVLLAKDTGALWDPLGGILYHVLAQSSNAPEPAWPPAWHFVVGVAVVVAFARIGYRWSGELGGDRIQKKLGVAFAVGLVAIGIAVLVGHETDSLGSITAWFARYGHLGFLAALSTALGASAHENGRTYARLVILFLVSCIFYHAWAAAMHGAYQYMLALLLGTIVLDFYLALWISRTQDAFWRRALLVLSIASNLGILGVFKYYDFFAIDVLQLSVDPLELVLPAGISFHTFQSMSYTVDVYRKKLEPTRSVLHFATFVLFFPQLVAGPIVRATELLPQLTNLPKYDYHRAADGLFRIVVGLFKKIALSDFLARAIVDRAFQNPDQYSSVEMLAAVYGFALQIYLDFSAYSDIAIGSAQVLGFELPENFRTPYRSSNLQEFWRRWHISLSTWLRDYLYIPLGGSKRGGWFTYRNLIITMLLGGLWHGANWTYIVWGALHGFGLAVTRWFQRLVDVRGVGLGLVRPLAFCVGFAATGGVLHALVLSSLDPWAQLFAAWVYLVPLWALATVALSSVPLVVPLRGRGISRPGAALILRGLACAAFLGLFAALGAGASSLYLPLVVAVPLLAGIADFTEAGLDGAEQERILLGAAARALAILLVFHYVCLAWIFFRAHSFAEALLVLESLGAWTSDAPNLIPVIVTALAAGYAAHFFPERTFAWLRARFIALGPMEQAAVLVGAAFLLRELSHPTIIPFFYNQF